MSTRCMRALLLCTLAVTLNCISAAADSVRTRQLMNFGWRFHAGDITNGQSLQTTDDDWRQVNPDRTAVGGSWS